MASVLQLWQGNVFWEGVPESNTLNISSHHSQYWAITPLTVSISLEPGLQRRTPLVMPLCWHRAGTTSSASHHSACADTPGTPARIRQSEILHRPRHVSFGPQTFPNLLWNGVELWRWRGHHQLCRQAEMVSHKSICNMGSASCM